MPKNVSEPTLWSLAQPRRIVAGSEQGDPTTALICRLICLCERNCSSRIHDSQFVVLLLHLLCCSLTYGKFVAFMTCKYDTTTFLEKFSTGPSCLLN